MRSSASVSIRAMASTTMSSLFWKRSIRESVAIVLDLDGAQPSAKERFAGLGMTAALR